MKELLIIEAKEIKKGMILKSAFSFVEVVDVKVRKKTTQVFYKSTYNGYESEKPWLFKNNETVRIKQYEH